MTDLISPWEQEFITLPLEVTELNEIRFDLRGLPESFGDLIGYEEKLLIQAGDDPWK